MRPSLRAITIYLAYLLASGDDHLRSKSRSGKKQNPEIHFEDYSSYHYTYAPLSLHIVPTKYHVVGLIDGQIW